jgi:glycosyltransferase involved in cell wall biosynthesis
LGKTVVTETAANAERTWRILHTEASLGWGGQEIRLLTEAQKFAEMGHQVHLLCDVDSDIYSAAPDYGIDATAVPFKRKSLAGLGAVRRFITSWGPDVINCHSSIDHWLTAWSRIGLTRRPAIVRTRHISAPVSRNAPTRWLYNKGCAFVMTTSTSMAGALTVDGFLPPERVAAVPTGIDADRFCPGDKLEARRALGCSEEAIIFGIVATLRSWKGHRFLLEALADIDTDGTVLLIVGDGPQEPNLKQLIGDLGLKDRVRMVGRQADVLPFLRAMDIFVLPSYENEGVPQALLQAMACTVPAIAGAIGGIPELVDGLGATRQVAPKDTGALREAMVEMMENPPEAADCNALRDRVIGLYTVKTMYERVVSVFDQSIGQQ